MKKFICLLLSSVLVISLVLTGCNASKKNSYIFTVTSETLGDIELDLTDIAERYYTDEEQETEDIYNRFLNYAEGFKQHLSYSNTVSTAYPDKEYGFQLEEPAEGEEIAIIRTNMGDIYVRLFPEGAPLAVENFVTHAKEGYYNGLTFHSLINDVVQGGDPNGDGTGGESIWGHDFGDEFDQKLLNVRGALAMAHRGYPDTNGSQFFINQNKSSITTDSKKIFNVAKVYKTYVEAYEFNIEVYKTFNRDYLQIHPTFESFMEKGTVGFSPVSYLVPEEVWKIYDNNGGNIHLDGAWRSEGGYTVFGQVFKGMDVVDVISRTSIDEKGKPEIDIIIHKIDIVNYEKAE